MFATIFLDMKIAGEKSLPTLPVPSMIKITEVKNDTLFFLHTSSCYFLPYFCQTSGLSVNILRTGDKRFFQKWCRRIIARPKVSWWAV